ncbi:MAG: MOSC domain-containing protein [Chloroflexi bacterium]|nr:MOSC domain-containing protein [Chloroflexota bacterium]
MAKILAVCWSEHKRTSKKDIKEGVFIENYGLTDDAHASGEWHRQVSLMATESIKKMRDLGIDVGPGSFGENLTTEGIDLVSLPVGSEVKVGPEVVLEISQIGKVCHTKCSIYYKVGQCIMPEEGIFAKVIRGGTVKAGDEIKAVVNAK